MYLPQGSARSGGNSTLVTMSLITESKAMLLYVNAGKSLVDRK
jgi:hypothetical protein